MGESVFNKMVSALLFQLAQKVRQMTIQTFQIWSLTIYVLQAKLPEQWDIVCINKFSRLDVKGQKILLVRDVIQTVMTGLKCRIGEPEDISKNAAENGSLKFQPIEIP